MLSCDAGVGLLGPPWSLTPSPDHTTARIAVRDDLRWRLGQRLLRSTVSFNPEEYYVVGQVAGYEVHLFLFTILVHLNSIRLMEWFRREGKQITSISQFYRWQSKYKFKLITLIHDMTISILHLMICMTFLLFDLPKFTIDCDNRPISDDRF